APKERARIAEPDRPLAPARAGVKPLDARLRDTIARKARVEDLHPRIRVARALLPGRKSRPDQSRRGSCAHTRKHRASGDIHSVPPVFASYPSTQPARVSPSACASTFRIRFGSASPDRSASATQRAPFGARVVAGTGVT